MLFKVLSTVIIIIIIRIMLFKVLSTVVPHKRVVLLDVWADDGFVLANESLPPSPFFKRLVWPGGPDNARPMR